ncbi:MAG: hypothetical protein ACYC3I_19100 [Gemmataceae bacterium]
MAEATRLVRDDVYEEMASSYQCLQVSILDAALQENGIIDAAHRHKICESFLFVIGEFHDQGWFKPSAGADRVYPLLCFSKRFLNTDTPVGELGEIFAPFEMFAFHESAIGNAALLYEGDPNAQVETGYFTDDE